MPPVPPEPERRRGRAQALSGLDTQAAGGFVGSGLQLPSSAGDYCQQKPAGTALVTPGKLPSLSVSAAWVLQWRVGVSCGVWALEHVGSVVAIRWLSGPTARGILAPQPEVELASSALEGRFLTTEPPGKSCMSR